MIWSEHLDSGRGLAAPMWLAFAIVASAWRLGVRAATTDRGLPRTGPRRRLGRVSQEWLREHAAEWGKHDGR